MLEKKIIRAIVVILGLAIGLSIARALVESQVTAGFNATQKLWFTIVAYSIISIGFGIVGYVLSPKLANSYIIVTKTIERRFQDMSLAEIFIGVVGLIIGLIVAYLISTLTFKIEPKILGILISVVIFMICGYLGWAVPTKRIKEINLPKWLKKSDRSNGRVYALPKVLDTSAIIDGRFFDVCKTGIVEGTIIIPRFVLDELRHISDSADSIKRTKGRRGLDLLDKMGDSQSIVVYDKDYPEIQEVDARLLKFTADHHAMLVTTDYNLIKVATVQGIPVFNINDLANALKTSMASGEEMVVSIIKEGKEATQGIAYLDDGTMIVVDGAKEFVGQQVPITVTSVLQTSAGKMIFAKVK